MIQIIKGTFGYYNGRKIVPITEADGPQKFDPDLEKRLVNAGVAKYVGASQQPEDPPTPDPAGANAPQDPEPPESNDTPAADPDTDGKELPAYSEDMKLDELKVVAIARGLSPETVAPMRKKADVIAAIKAAEAAEDEGNADDEQPPQLGAADPV